MSRVALKALQAAAGNVVAAEPGEAIWTTIGTNSWTVPSGVTSVSVVCIGGGGTRNTSQGTGGGGGGLGYKNDIAVTPGSTITVEVGTYADDPPLPNNGGDSYFVDATTVKGGGGGAGGYSGAGGNGANGVNGGSTFPSGSAGSGGGSGGGAGGTTGRGGRGGGTGYLGEGASGAGGTGNQGSGGNGSQFTGSGFWGYGAQQNNTSTYRASKQGAVRIVWPGGDRQFPTTDVDQSSSVDIYVNGVLQ